MIFPLAAAAAVLLTLEVCLITLVQMFYLESLRLRVRELASQEFFRSTLADRLGMDTERGALTFSLIKHSALVMLGCVFVAGAATRPGPFWQTGLEACLMGWAAMLLAAYVAPQAFYRKSRCQWLIAAVPLLRLQAAVVRPLVLVLSFLHSLSELNRRPEASETAPGSEENIEALIEAGAEEGLIEEEDRKLIHSVVAFGDKTVREVMTPRPNIVGIEVGRTLEDLRQLVIHEQYSRVPVYEDNIDNIIGFVHVRDMFELDRQERAAKTVRELMRPISAVPESKPVNDLLREMQADGVHMAVVVDEYGNTAGLATLEDLVEEILGEIRDEHEPTEDVTKDGSGGYLVSGNFDVDNLRDLLGFRPHEETESTTVGGLVTEWLGRVPRPGETVDRDGIRIEVLAGNELRVERVRVQRAPGAANG